MKQTYYVVRQPDETLWLCFSKPVRWAGNGYLAGNGYWSIEGVGYMVRLPDGDFEEVKSSAKEPAELELSLTIKAHRA